MGLVTVVIVIVWISDAALMQDLHEVLVVLGPRRLIGVEIGMIHGTGVPAARRRLAWMFRSLRQERLRPKGMMA
tara:strand:+ start:1591 stop:1812 length:222 start_codon:yes stop_codon:yes gene_type:complete